MILLPELRALRQTQALSMRDLAQRAGVSPASVFRAEQGKPMYPTTVRKLAKALGVTPAELRGDAPEVPAPVPVSERQAIMVANLLDQAERARARGDDEGVATFERMAASAAANADGVS